MSATIIGAWLSLNDRSEILRAGDEYQHKNEEAGAPWKPIDAAIGDRVSEWSDRYVFRRPIDLGANPTVTITEQPTTPPPSMCGCGKHTIDFGADPQVSHRDWVHDQTGVKVEGFYSPETMRLYAELMDKRIAGSRLTVLGPDSTGDDVAADAPRRK